MVRWSVEVGMRFGRLAIAVALGVLAVALFQLPGATKDIYPEFASPTVEIQAEALGLSAQEVEQLITVPLEQDLLNGIPWLAHIRSTSMAGLSAIDLEFEPGTDLYEARQAVQERMTQAKALPNVGTPPMMVQPTSSTSRVAMIALTSSTISTTQMSVEARWQIRPRLMSIPGVANVSIWGQRDRQLQVQVDPARLHQHQVTLTQLIEATGNALWVSPLSFVEASTPGTGGFVETPTQRIGVQHIQPITNSAQLAEIAVEGSSGQALKLKDVADVREDHQPVIGDASVDGTDGLMLVVERFPGADTGQVTRDVEAAMEAMKPGLTGIDIDPTIFRPLDYLTSALRNLGVAALIGLVALVGVAGLLLSSWRSALIVALTVPLSLVSASYVLSLRGQTLTLMTLLGLAAAAALVVDDVIGDVDQIRRQLRRAGPDGSTTVASAIADVVVGRRIPLLSASVIVILALAPVLSMGGLAGAFAKPAVITFALALGASTLVALLVTPALAALLGRGRGELRPSPVERWVHRGFDRTAPAVLRRPVAILLAALVLSTAAVVLVVVDGPGDPLPTLRDRNVLVRLQGAAGTSVSEMQRISAVAAGELRSIPGVQSAGANVGRAITSDEVVDVNAAEIWLKITPDADYADTLEKITSNAVEYPGLRGTVSTYADDRIDASAAAPSSDLVVRVYGTDFAKLQSTADEVASLLTTVPGVLSPRVESRPAQPTLEIQVDLKAAQRHGLRPGDVRREASTLISGLTVGSLYEQQKVFDVVVWGGPSTRQSISGLQSLLIDTPTGEQVQLGEVARVRLAANPVVVTHDAVSRSLDVSASVVGKDLSQTVAEVNSRLRGMTMPYEYRAEVVSDTLVAQHDQRRLVLIALVAVGLIFLLLQAAVSSWKGAAVLLVTLPLSVVGGVLVAPPLNGIVSVSVLAALVSVFALATRQSLLLVRRAREHPGPEGSLGAMTRAAREMAPSVLVTAAVTVVLVLPAALLGGVAGLEILQPFAVTLLCALPTAVATVLLAVPAFYAVATRNSSRYFEAPAELKTEVAQ
jgi:Cu/Ag efflux pump CusA